MIDTGYYSPGTRNPEHVDLSQEFGSGDYMYLRDSFAEASYRDLHNMHFPVQEIYPSSQIGRMSTEAVEDLAEANAKQQFDRRKWTHPTYMELFSAIRVGEGSHIGGVSLTQAVVVPHVVIQGEITGPNREMLDIVYELLGVQGDAEVTERHVARTGFGAPMAIGSLGISSSDWSTPEQVITNRRRDVSFRNRGKISAAWPQYRPKVNEQSVVFTDGENGPQSAVCVERIRFKDQRDLRTREVSVEQV